jgi:hypothetical protein
VASECSGVGVPGTLRTFGTLKVRKPQATEDHPIGALGREHLEMRGASGTFTCCPKAHGSRPLSCPGSGFPVSDLAYFGVPGGRKTPSGMVPVSQKDDLTS